MGFKKNMQIRFENYEKCYPKRLKRLFQSNLNYNTYDSFIPNMKRAVVGNLPPELIHFFPKSSRANDIKDFQNALSDITRYARDYYQRTKRSYLFDLKNLPSEDLRLFEEGMSNLFNKRIERISGKELTAEFKYTGHGAYGNVFKFSLKNKKGEKIMHDKALKVYHKKEQEFLANVHNNYAEANFWTYLKHAAGHKLDKTQFTRHYISDLHSGYVLTEFIDSDIRPTIRFLDMKNLFRIQSLDAVNNAPIMGKTFDAGGFMKTEDFIDDKVVLRYFKKLYYRNGSAHSQVASDLNSMCQNPKTPHRDKIQRAVELFKQQKSV